MFLCPVVLCHCPLLSGPFSLHCAWWRWLRFKSIRKQIKTFQDLYAQLSKSARVRLSAQGGPPSRLSTPYTVDMLKQRHLWLCNPPSNPTPLHSQSQSTSGIQFGTFARAFSHQKGHSNHNTYESVCLHIYLPIHVYLYLRPYLSLCTHYIYTRFSSALSRGPSPNNFRCVPKHKPQKFALTFLIFMIKLFESRKKPLALAQSVHSQRPAGGRVGFARGGGG